MAMSLRTTCDECGESLVLMTVDADGVLIGDECQCGYYVTRYMPGQAPDDGDTLGPCGCRDYHMADCPIRTG